MEPGAGDQHHAADAGRSRRAAGFADALDRKARGFRFLRFKLKLGDRDRDIGIEQIEIGKIFRQQRGIGKTDIFVFGRYTGHRHRALGQPRNAVAVDVVGRDHRLAPADQHPQADIVALGALGFLDTAVAHLDALRDAAHRDRIGRVGAGAFCGLDQPLGQRGQRRLIEQRGVGGLCGKRRCGGW